MKSKKRVWEWLLSFGILVVGTTSALAVGEMANADQVVQQARDWQRAGDIARAGHLWQVAYQYYHRIAAVFPDTPHGRYAHARAKKMREYLLAPARPPFKEDPVLWIQELSDFLTWP